MTVETAEPVQTLAEYKAERLAPPKPPEAKETKEPVEVVAEVVDEPKDEEKDEPKKGNAKLQGRFSELTEQRRQAEQRAEREAERAVTAERERDELKAKLAPPVVEEAPKPKPEDFADAFKYAEGLAEWTAKKVLKERDEADAAKARNAEADKVKGAWKERLTAAKEKYPDWDDVVTASELKVSDPVRDALIESEQGPEIVRMLALEPKLVDKINKLSLVGQLKEIGRLEAQFDKPVVKEEVVEKVPVERPRAPAPITPVKGTKVADNPTTEPGEFKGTYSEWKAARQKAH